MKFRLEQLECNICGGHVVKHLPPCPDCSGTGLQKAYVISEEDLENIIEFIKWSLNGFEVAMEIAKKDKKNKMDSSLVKIGLDKTKKALSIIIAPEEEK